MNITFLLTHQTDRRNATLLTPTDLIACRRAMTRISWADIPLDDIPHLYWLYRFLDASIKALEYNAREDWFQSDEIDNSLLEIWETRQ
jgi:hypothetical protein